MSTLTIFRSRRFIKGVAALSMTIGTVAMLGTFGAPQAVARIIGQPIDVLPRTGITPGSALACDIKLTAASTITISSNPPGYVSYTGYANATSTVYAATAPNATGNVTIYLKTDGATIVERLAICNPTLE